MIQTANYKRIAKNTLFLYFRMGILMLVAFYTSRILLKELGVEDFGIYGIVGGVVALFSSLRGLFATATQRFLNYEMGKGNTESLNKVFNISVLINCGISVIFFIVAETVGLWFLEHKLVIASERLSAAHVAFHCSILASMISILTIPFDALIIANEKMSFYAYVSILDAFLKLGIIFILPVFDFDKLKLYAILVIIVAFIIRSISSIYCKKKFSECKYKLCWDKKLFKEMGTFAGWNFAGNFAFALVNEGLNILLNLFGGVVANAARTIAYQIKNAITTILSNVILAIEPQATQLYAQERQKKFYNLLFTASKVIAFFYLLIAFPLYFYTQDILQIWLGEIPQYATDFIQAILIYLAVRSFHEPINIFFFIIGQLKAFQITELIILTLSLPLSYLALKFFTCPLHYIFHIMAIIEFINLTIILMWAKKIGKFHLQQYIKQVCKPYICTFFFSIIILYCIRYYFYPQQKPFLILILIAISIIIFIITAYLIGFSKDERKTIKAVVKHK